jgi:hypothetical protein
MTRTYNQMILKNDSNGNVIQESYIGDMTFRGDYTGTNLIHKGYARPGASEGANVWQIALLAYDGANNLLSIKWPQDVNGFPSSEFDFNWTGRAGYTYA